MNICSHRGQKAFAVFSFYRYRTPLWGFSGHLQTIAYGLWGRFTDTSAVQGERRSVVVRDGTTVTYDVFEPNGGSNKPYMILLVPGEPFTNFIFIYDSKACTVQTFLSLISKPVT